MAIDAMDDGRLAGKTAIVVGAGQTPGLTIGNGRATAIRFAAAGAEVLLVDVDPVSVNETAEMIRRDGGRAHVHVADITDGEAVRELPTVATTRLGRIDILYNGVGIGSGDGSVTRVSEEAWDRIMDVNLKAMWLTCKHVLPVMREQRSGAIVCVSSIAATAAANHLAAYKISKAGVNALVHLLATGNARFGVRANGIMPGLIDTPMGVDAVASAAGIPREQLAEERAARVPLGRQGTAWDIAAAALFLASDDASFITGVVLPVDGGSSCLIG